MIGDVVSNKRVLVERDAQIEDLRTDESDQTSDILEHHGVLRLWLRIVNPPPAELGTMLRLEDLVAASRS